MSHHKLTVYDDIPAKALEEEVSSSRPGESRGVGSGSSGTDTQVSPYRCSSLPEQHLPDSVVRDNPGGLKEEGHSGGAEEEAKVYSDLGSRVPDRNKVLRQELPPGQTYKQDRLPGAGASVQGRLWTGRALSLLLTQAAWLLTLWPLPWVGHFSRVLEVPTS